MTIGNVIQKYREEHGLSQRQFANICGLSNSYISILENGVNPKTGKPSIPTISNYVKIASAMGIDLNTLFEMTPDQIIEVNKNGIFESEEETELLDVFRSLNQANRSAVLNFAKFQLSQQV